MDIVCVYVDTYVLVNISVEGPLVVWPPESWVTVDCEPPDGMGDLSQDIYKRNRKC